MGEDLAGAYTPLTQQAGTVDAGPSWIPQPEHQNKTLPLPTRLCRAAVLHGCGGLPVPATAVQRAHGSGPQQLRAAFYGPMIPHFC